MRTQSFKWCSSTRVPHTALDVLTWAVVGWSTHQYHPRILAMLHNTGKPTPLCLIHASLKTGYSAGNIKRLINDLANVGLVEHTTEMSTAKRIRYFYALTQKGKDLIATAQRKGWREAPKPQTPEPHASAH